MLRRAECPVREPYESLSGTRRHCVALGLCHRCVISNGIRPIQPPLRRSWDDRREFRAAPLPQPSERRTWPSRRRSRRSGAVLPPSIALSSLTRGFEPNGMMETRYYDSSATAAARRSLGTGQATPTHSSDFQLSWDGLSHDAPSRPRRGARRLSLPKRSEPVALGTQDHETFP